MHELLSVFALDYKTLNKIRNIILHLRKHNRTIDEFLEYAETSNKNHQKIILEMEKAKANQVLCPECKKPMVLRPVNFNKSTQTGDNSKSVWLCFNKVCLYVEYSDKTIDEWRSELKT